MEVATVTVTVMRRARRQVRTMWVIGLPLFLASERHQPLI
jgi:hypothetical protein